jgi:hypothetical protein
MPPRRRNILILSALLLIVLVVVLYLRFTAPPRIVRLLPESDAIVYLNVAPIRAATQFDRTPATPSPSLQQFIDATGIIPERDLNAVAVSLLRMTDPTGPNGPVAYSEVFTGHFDTPRLERYLASLALAQQPYAGRTIYAIPSEGRLLRVTLLDAATLAASNAPTPEQIHAIIDRDRAFTPFAEPSLLADRYPDIPSFSSAWAVGHIGLPFAEDGKVTLAGLRLPIPADATFVASLRYTTALNLRVDQLATDPTASAQSAQSLNNLLTLLRTIPSLQKSPNPALTQILNSITITAQRDRATLTATIPAETLKLITKP